MLILSVWFAALKTSSGLSTLLLVTFATLLPDRLSPQPPTLTPKTKKKNYIKLKKTKPMPLPEAM